MPAIAAAPARGCQDRPPGCCASMSAASCRGCCWRRSAWRVYAAATAAQAWLLEPILDRVFLERDRQMLVLVPLAVVAIAVLKAGAGYSQTAAMARAGQRIVADLQRRLFDHVIRADVGDVTERGPGPLISGPDLRHAAAARRRVVEPHHRRPRSPDRPVPDRADVLARLAARHARPDRPAARDLADQPGEHADPRGRRAQPGRDGRARGPRRAGLPRHPPGQGRPPRSRRIRRAPPP